VEMAHPSYQCLPFLHKPPLYFWLEAGAFNVLGLSPFTGRLVSLASGVLVCTCVYAFVRPIP